MDKRYFYLGADRTTPKGPHTLPELSGMLLRGEITPATEVAAEGDSRWLALGSLLMQSPVNQYAPNLPPIPGENTPGASISPFLPPLPQKIGSCPACKQELPDGESGQLPTECPHCGFRLRPANDTTWQYIRFGLSRLFTWRGRATRKEYWSTWFALLIGTLPLLFLSFLTFTVCTAISLSKHTGTALTAAEWASDITMLPAWITIGIFLIYELWTAIVLISMTVRRLHDIGRSGWIFLAACIASIMWQAYYYYKIAISIAAVNWKLIFAIEDTISRNERIKEITTDLNMVAYEGWGAALYLINMALGLLIFVLMLMDSERGANKYGPSSKYPHG
ncbi:MAG: DUF805 domain-containing protein [Akkermansia sp.]|nr:DUF805 domain-containing protein [Akkermansia sp.]